MIDRRKLLKAGAGAVPMLLLKTRSGLAMTNVLVGNDDMDWQQRLRRIGQTNMTEHDPAVMDVEAWADYWASLKVGATFISVTGILAFYPTKVPFHRRAKYLGDRDFFGELNAAGAQAGYPDDCAHEPGPELGRRTGGAPRVVSARRARTAEDDS